MNVLHFNCDNIPPTEDGAHLAAVFCDHQAASSYAQQCRREASPGERVTVSKRVIKVEKASLRVWCVTFRRWPAAN